MNCNVSTFEQPLLRVPSAMVTFRSSEGSLRVLPAAWVGIVCSNPLTLSVAIRSGRVEPYQEKVFAVNLPVGDLLASPFLAKILAEREGDFSSSGLTFSAGSGSGTFLIEECPVRIECCRGTTRSRFGQDFICGEVMVVHAGEVTFAGDALPASPRRLKRFTRAWNRCLNSGAGQAQA